MRDREFDECGMIINSYTSAELAGMYLDGDVHPYSLPYSDEEVAGLYDPELQAFHQVRTW